MDPISDIKRAENFTGLDDFSRRAALFFLRPDPARTLAGAASAGGVEVGRVEPIPDAPHIMVLYGRWAGMSASVYLHRLQYHDCLAMYMDEALYLNRYWPVPGEAPTARLLAVFQLACTKLQARIAWFSDPGPWSLLSWVLDDHYDTGIAIGNPMGISAELHFEMLYMDSVFERMYDRAQVIDSRREEIRVDGGLLISVPTGELMLPEDLEAALEELRRRLGPDRSEG